MLKIIESMHYLVIGKDEKENVRLKLMLQKGIGVLFLILSVGVILSVGFLLYKLAPKATKNSYLDSTRNEAKTVDEPPLKLKSIGINLDYFDSKANMAGDFKFTKQKLQFNQLFMGFGFVIPSDVSSSGKDKVNPQPTFVVPLGTPVRSLVDGTVSAIPVLWSGDYSVMVIADGKSQKWVYETEHLIKPRVKVGDTVTAGQIVGQVSNFNQGAPAGFGSVEIGILKGGNPPQHVCPFAYLDASIRDETLQKIRAFYKDWKAYLGDQTLDAGQAQAIPGCLTLDSIEG